MKQIILNIPEKMYIDLVTNTIPDAAERLEKDINADFTSDVKKSIYKIIEFELYS